MKGEGGESIKAPEPQDSCTCSQGREEEVLVFARQRDMGGGCATVGLDGDSSGPFCGNRNRLVLKVGQRVALCPLGAKGEALGVWACGVVKLDLLSGDGDARCACSVECWDEGRQAREDALWRASY